MSNWITGIVSGGKLYCRKSPSANAAYWGRFNDGQTIPVKVYNDTWFETYWDDNTSKVGYVMRTYIDAATHPDISMTYNVDNAVNYALSHSTQNSSGADPKRNTTFGNATTNDCANFVSQCLCAGGLPMFNGWSYKLDGIPAGWNSKSKWKLTYSGCQKLLGKNRIYQITDVTKAKKGDIIYTYDSSKAKGYQYTHVTIAVDNYSSSIGGCHVCGHSVNQNKAEKALKSSKVRIYRVKSRFVVGGNEKRIDFSSCINGGNGGTVINDTF